MIQCKIEWSGDAEDVVVVVKSLASFVERVFIPVSVVPPPVSAAPPPVSAGMPQIVLPPSPGGARATVAPDQPWVSPSAEVPDSGAPSLPQATEEQLADGADMWMGLLVMWDRGFDDQSAEQPDRLGALSRAIMEGGSRMFAVLRHYGGLTRLVRSLLATMPKKRARRISENIAQVSSAAGIPVVSDYLEYTEEYLSKEYHNDKFNYAEY